MFNANGGFVRSDTNFLGKSDRPRLDNVGITALRWALSAAVGLAMFSCGNPDTHFIVSAPSSVMAGTPFTVTVTAIANGARDTIYNLPVHFTSSDSAAILPADYRFTAADSGSHTFTNGVTLMTAGSQSITATCVVAASITGTANVTVSATTEVIAQNAVDADAIGYRSQPWARKH